MRNHELSVAFHVSPACISKITYAERIKEEHEKRIGRHTEEKYTQHGAPHHPAVLPESKSTFIRPLTKAELMRGK